MTINHPHLVAGPNGAGKSATSLFSMNLLEYKAYG